MRYRISFEMDTAHVPGPEVWFWKNLLESLDDDRTKVDFGSLKVEGSTWEELEYDGN